MGGIKVATLYAALSLDAANFNRNLQTSVQNASGFKGKTQALFGGLTSFLTSPAGIVGAAAAVAAFGAAAVTAADEARRAADTVANTFGASSQVVIDASNEMLLQWGIQDEEFQLAASSLGLWLQNTGMTEEASAALAVQMGELAAQISVAKDIPYAEAMELVTKATQGGSRAARTLGVDISGMTTAQERANAILAGTIPLQETATARQDSMAVTSARVGARVGEAMEKIGEAILKVADAVMPIIMAAFDALWPVVEVALDIIVNWIKIFMAVMQEIMKVVGPILQKVGEAFGGLGKVIGGIFDGVKTVVKGSVNFVIGIINGFIRLINGIQVHIPRIGIGPLAVGPFDWWGLRLGTIPYLASGVKGFPGGWAMVGERGPELVNLPGGSDVYSNAATRRMGGGMVVQGPLVAIENFNGSDAEIDALSEKLARKVRLRMGYMET